MVQPIALQDNLGKTPIVEKITQIEKSQPELAQKGAAAEVQRKAVQQKTKPPPTLRADEVTIHRDEQQKQGQQQKKEDSDTEPEKPEDNESEIKHLDLHA